ncbi:GxxExxY protein [Pelotalea chapellei]|uniref:GxxExxY protein n=1 Tax=Pelotalea chapellei TaxID=44671 RepID=A0ABS5U5P3_9BACT|nr:GxxExxY protein [Pelotalea chapellei]MBT1070974.1 GxxExxY protein [Pelotalea chapellei]
MTTEILHRDLTEKIIRCALEVHNVLGSGFLEKVYENALLQELTEHGLDVSSQALINVMYKGKTVGDYVADLLVDGRVIVELKAVDKLSDVHDLQLKNYLKATGNEVGLLLNFGKSLEIRRKFVAAECPMK